MTAEELQSIIAAGLACDHLEVEGDGRHWSGGDRLGRVRRQAPHPAPPARLRDAGCENAYRRGACALDEDLHAGRMGGRNHTERIMDKLLIRGGRQLHGEVRISGAKNAALPELCAALLTDQPVVLQNVPRLQDVATMLTLIRNMGVTIERDENGTVRIDSARLQLARSALRAGQDHARLGAGARPAAGALRRGHGVAAGRLRDRLAAGRPAHQGPAGHGRRDRGRARLHDRQAAQGPRAAARAPASAPT